MRSTPHDDDTGEVVQAILDLKAGSVVRSRGHYFIVPHDGRYLIHGGFISLIEEPRTITIHIVDQEGNQP